MANDPKSLADMGFNVAIMASFAIPEGGPVIAAGLSAGQALFDIFFQLPDRRDPGTFVVTRNDLENAINELKSYIDDANFRSDLDARQSTISTIYTQVRDVCDDNAKVKDRAKRGPLSTGEFDTEQIKTWKTEIDGYKNVILAVPAPLLDALIWIAGKPQHANQTLSLYMLGASLWNMVCKLNVAFEYNMALYDYKAAEAQYNTDMNTYHTAHAAWKIDDPDTRGPEPQKPVEPVKPEDNDGFLNGSRFAEKLSDNIDDFIDYVTPKLADLAANFKSRTDQVDNRLAQITLLPVPGGYCYYDAALDKTSAVETYKEVAEGQMEAYQGSIRLALWDRLTKEFALTGIEGEEIEIMQKTLKAWHETKEKTAPV